MALSISFALCQCASAATANVDLAWDPAAVADVTNYTIYYSTVSFLRAGTWMSTAAAITDSAVRTQVVLSTYSVQTTTVTLSGLTQAMRYYLRITVTSAGSGESAFNADINGRDLQLMINPGPPPNPIISGVGLSSITVSYATTSAAGYGIEASTTAGDFADLILSSYAYYSVVYPSTTQDASLALQGLMANTTYYLRAAALWNQTTYYANTAPAAASTLSNPVLHAFIAIVFNSSITVNWNTLALSPSTQTAEGYLLQASTAPDFSGTIYSSATQGVSLSTLTVSGLIGGNIYYLRTASLNWNGLPNFTAVGSTLTWTPVCLTISYPISGDKVWGTVLLGGTAFDKDAQVDSVFVSTDLTTFNVATGTAPWSYQWNTIGLTAGAYTVAIKAVDTLGNKALSSVSINLINGTAPRSPWAYAYPNPAVSQDPVIRAVLGLVDSFDLTIFDVAGTVVLNRSIDASHPTGLLNNQYYYDFTWPGHKASGVYFAVVNGKLSGTIVAKARAKFAVVR